MAPAFTSRSRAAGDGTSNSQIVVASGTRSPSDKPRKRMNDSRSLRSLLAAFLSGVGLMSLLVIN